MVTPEVRIHSRGARRNPHNPEISRRLLVRIPVPSTRSVNVPESMSSVNRSSNSLFERIEVRPQHVASLRRHVALDASQRNRASHQSRAEQLVLQPEETLAQGLRATGGNRERDVGGEPPMSAVWL